MKFNCTKCGACCTNVGNTIKEIQSRPEMTTHPGEKLLLAFPYGFKENGTTCEKYDPEIGCTIYESRPIICNTELMAPIYQLFYGWDQAEYYKIQAKNCNLLIITAELPFRYLIPPGLEIIS